MIRLRVSEGKPQVHLCPQASFPACSNQNTRQKNQELPTVRRIVLSKQIFVYSQKCTRVAFLFVRTPVCSYLQVIQMPKIIALSVETACKYTFTHSRLYLRCFLMVIFNSKSGVVCSSPSKSTITIILGYFYSQEDEKYNRLRYTNLFQVSRALVFSSCSALEFRCMNKAN
jgi:hypothetical protein